MPTSTPGFAWNTKSGRSHGKLAGFWLHHTPHCRVTGSKSVPDVLPSPHSCAAVSKNVPECLLSPHTYSAIGLGFAKPCRISTSQRRDPVSFDMFGLAHCNLLVDFRCVLHVTSSCVTLSIQRQNSHGATRREISPELHTKSSERDASCSLL